MRECTQAATSKKWMNAEGYVDTGTGINGLALKSNNYI